MALTFLVISLLLPKTPASAHAAALGTEPAPGATVDGSPPQILVRFGSPVEISLGSMRLVDGVGKNVAIGAPVHPLDEKNAVAASVPALPDGGYLAIYQITAADGHITRGSFTFQIGRASVPVSPNLVTKLSATGDQGALPLVTNLTRQLLYSAVMITLGGLLFTFVCWPDGIRTRRATRVLTATSVLSIAASLTLLALAAGSASGRGLAGVVDRTGWRSVLASHAANWWEVRSLGTIVALAAVLFRRHPSRLIRYGLLAVSSLAVFLGMAKGGHGTSGQWPTIGVTTTVVHLAASSAWVGGLVLAFVSLSTGAGVTAVRRFSRVALWSVVGVVGSGAIQTVRQLRSWSGWSTPYGASLRSKLVVVAVLIVIGGASRLLLRRPDLAATVVGSDAAEMTTLSGDSATPTPTPTADATDTTAIPVSAAAGSGVGLRLRDLVALEVLFAAGVLALTVSLSNTPPPSPAVAKPFATVLTVAGRSADIIVEPGAQGVNAVHVTVTNNDGSIRNPRSITIRLSLATKDIPPIQAEPTQRLANHASFERVVLPFSGQWNLEVFAVYGNETVRFSTPVKIR